MDAPLSLALAMAAGSVLAVLGALWLAAAAEAWRARRPEPAQAPPRAAAFLIDGGSVTDANPPGRALLATLAVQAGGAAGDGGDWTRLCHHLLRAYPGLDAAMRGDGAHWSLPGAAPTAPRLTGDRVAGGWRLTLDVAAEGGARDGSVTVDALSWTALGDELDLLRRTTDTSPAPTWRQDAQGQVVWANGAYLRLLAELGTPGPLSWPLPPLFAPDAVLRGGRSSPLPATPGTAVAHWFDLVAATEGEGHLIFALPADAAQQAERTRRDFVQTLSRTFATLPVGLAVFDRGRRLQLFNPALADLTGLEPEFLAARPGLEGVLNRMRDKHIMPEPRDYRAWSRRLMEVEAAAQGGGFEETWALPDGRSFKVSAAPHPDGALAFLIEDVTSDIRLKRSFRAELDAAQAALDLADDGIAVFSAGGDLVLTNAAFDHLWTLEGAETLAGVRLRDALSNWREASVGGDVAIWDRVAALAGPPLNSPVSSPSGLPMGDVAGTVDLGEGDLLSVCARRAPGGGISIAFRALDDARRVAEPTPLRRPDRRPAVA